LRNDGWPTAQYNSSINSELWRSLSIASTRLATVATNYTRDKKPNDNYKSKLANYSLEGAVDMDLLVAMLSSMGKSKGTVNLFWTLSHYSYAPFVRATN